MTIYLKSDTVCDNTVGPIELNAIMTPTIPVSNPPFSLTRSICSLDRLFLSDFGLVGSSFVFESTFCFSYFLSPIGYIRLLLKDMVVSGHSTPRSLQ